MEGLVAQDPVRIQEDLQQRREDAACEALFELFRCFPTQLTERFVALCEDEIASHEGIYELLSCIENGTWKPRPIPAAVAEVWLTDHQASPWLRCKDCELLLPKRRGFWHNTQTGGWWQSSMRYFVSCPACEGEIVPRGEDRSWHACSPFPVRPEPPWEFLDEPPGTR